MTILATIRRNAADVWIALVVAAAQIGFTTLAANNQPERGALDALGYVLLAVGPAALLARRRYPVAVLAVVLVSTLVYWSLGDTEASSYPRGPAFVALIVAYVTAVQAGQRRAAWASLAVGYPAFLWLGPLLGDQPAPTFGHALVEAGWLLVVAAGGEILRVRSERALEADRMRHEEARRRADEERLLIARELHDVLAHHVSLINVQAGVALHLIDERPEQARTALAAIKEASGETLRELRSVVGALRSADEEAPRSPVRGLADLEDLVSRSAGTPGLHVETEVAGRQRPLPAGVDLAAFRIVQEGLTNVVRHAGATTATVRVDYGERDLVLEVTDDGRGAAGDGGGEGSGIAGMRERASALGGELSAGPLPGGGFRLRARLPLEEGA